MLCGVNGIATGPTPERRGEYIARIYEHTRRVRPFVGAEEEGGDAPASKTCDAGA